MIYEDKKKNDQIASSSGQSGFADSQRLSAGILTSLFTQAFYTIPVVCYLGAAAVFKDRLSRHYTNAQRLLRFTQGLGIKENTSLFNTLLCREAFAKKRAFEKLLNSIFKLARDIGLLSEAPEAAIDSTGLETHHISRHFVNCTKRPSYFRRTWPKMTVICDTDTHLIAGCIVTRGPSYDFSLFEKALCHVTGEVSFSRILADAGYDSEANHRLGREVFGMDTIIALNLRGFNKTPSTTYRKEMYDNFKKEIYNRRWQVESVFSRNKRLLGSALRNRSESARQRECLLRTLTHNLMIIRRAA
jgi:transposase